MATINFSAEIFAQNALLGFVKKLVPFAAFSTNFSGDMIGQKGETVIVPLIGLATATTFGGSYAISGGSITGITVPIDQHKIVPVSMTDIVANSSSVAKIEQFAIQQGAALGTEVLRNVFGLVTTANFGLVTAVASTAMDVPQLRRGKLVLNQDDVPDDYRSMVLDCVPYDALLGVTNFVQAHMFKDNTVLAEGKVMRALGFDFHEVNNLFTSGASVMGFAAHASAIAVASRYLAPQEGNTYNYAGQATDDNSGLTIGVRDFYDNASGTRYVAIECNFGRSVGISYGGRIYKRTD